MKRVIITSGMIEKVVEDLEAELVAAVEEGAPLAFENVHRAEAKVQSYSHHHITIDICIYR